jgi:predicted nucleic acid-binding protein
MNLTVDASVLVAASRADKVHYRASRQFLQQIQAQRCDLYCPTLVLPECSAAIARPTADASMLAEYSHPFAFRAITRKGYYF